MSERVYCSTLARDAAEPLAGTASHAEGCVLLSFPKRMWARDALASPGLAVLGDAFDRLGDGGVAVRLVAHEEPWRERVEVSAYPGARRWRDVPLGEVARVLERREGGEPITRPVIAVCTHGLRDRCCALFGGRVAAALKACGDAVDVREASHLGGDRFAPTVLVLPSGDMFGHLTEADAPSLIEAALGRPTLAAHFRGSLWRDPLEQLAEADARARGGRVVGVITREDERGERATLRFDVEIGERRESTTLRCVRENRLVMGDCRHADEGRRGNVRVWRVMP